MSSYLASATCARVASGNRAWLQPVRVHHCRSCYLFMQAEVCPDLECLVHAHSVSDQLGLSCDHGLSRRGSARSRERSACAGSITRSSTCGSSTRRLPRACGPRGKFRVGHVGEADRLVIVTRTRLHWQQLRFACRALMRLGIHSECFDAPISCGTSCRPGLVVSRQAASGTNGTCPL